MRNRLLALTAIAAPLAAVALSAPASAQPGSECGAYPPGNAYGLRGSHNGSSARHITVPKGGNVDLAARVFRNGENCSGRSVTLFVHGPRDFNRDGSPAYHVSGYATTDSFGLAHVNKTVSTSFRWYFGYTSDNGTGIATNRGADMLVIAGK